MLVIGIDPGRYGGFAMLNQDGLVVGLRPLPYERPELLASFLASLPHRLERVRVYLEMAQSHPKDSGKAMFAYGRGFGTLLGILIATQTPYILVPSATWSRDMHLGTPATSDTKKRSIMAAKRLFPGVNLMETERCRVEHDGMAEALLIAEYGRRLLLTGGRAAG